MTIVKYIPTTTPNIGEVKIIDYVKNEVTEPNEIAVENIVYPENIQGKAPITYVNLDTKVVYYEYVDRPLTPQEQLMDLQSQNAQMIMALVQGGLM